MPPLDDYAGFDNIVSSARHLTPIVPSDPNPLATIPKAIRCDVAGTVALRAVDDVDFQSITMTAGEVLPLRVAHVKATGTTATLHGLT